MKITDVKVIVFDFDGTLVQSNQIKHDAYFDLFPKNESTRLIVQEVLSDNFERSRYFILKSILSKRCPPKKNLNGSVQKLAEKYNQITLRKVSKCPEVKNAGTILAKLYKTHKLYVSSTTPERALKELVRKRKWNQFFSGIFGYPNSKRRTLLEIIRREKVSPSDVLVVGDGKSDQVAAEKNNCLFIQVDSKINLMKLFEK